MDSLSKFANPHKRRWYQFSLRTLFIFTFVCAIPCAWLAMKIRAAERQRNAVKVLAEYCRLANYGISVCYDDNWKLNCSDLENKEAPIISRLFHRILGEDFFHDVTIVGFEVATDDEMATLESFPNLRTLFSNICSVSDSGLAHLRNLSDLKELIMNSDSITDVGLENLTDKTQMEYLSLPFCGISDEGMKCISNMRKIRRLELYGNNLTDVGMAYIEGLSDLEELHLDYTHITDASIKYFVKFKKLRQLTLDDTQITDEGLRTLRASLTDCDVTLVR